MKQVKNRSNSKTNWWSKWLMQAGLSLLILPVVAIVWTCYAAYVSDNGMPVADDGSWSSEVLAGLHEKMIVSSPIPVANACGLGASSCFKCHNGKRAALPSKEPWHEQHAKVNHSCVGCHKGNERLMLQNMAHKDLVPDPRTNPQELCMDCHKDGDMQTLLGKYQKSQ
jgi:hypothetical protein